MFVLNEFEVNSCLTWKSYYIYKIQCCHYAQMLVYFDLCMQVCKHLFAFSPVYAHDTPTRLPFLELILGMAIKVGRGARFFMRLAFVLSVWLVFIPFTTFWIWRFTFVRSFAEAQRLFLSRSGFRFLLTDCLHGFLLSAGIIFIFLGATSLREYFHHQRALNPRHNGGQQGNLHGGAQRIRVGRLGGQHILEDRGQLAPEGVDDNDVDANIPRGLAIGAGHILRQNAENVAARLEIQAARLEAHVEQIFDAVEEADAAEDVPFDELVGMQGSIFRLLENAITVCKNPLVEVFHLFIYEQRNCNMPCIRVAFRVCFTPARTICLNVCFKRYNIKQSRARATQETIVQSNF